MATNYRQLGWFLLMTAFWGCTEPGEELSPHPDGFADVHAYKMRLSSYNLSSCQACHGENLQGTGEIPGCQTSECHSVPGGVAACTNSHADETSPIFENLAGDTDADILTVGVHTSHIMATHGLTDNVGCGSCHVRPDTLYDDKHLFGAEDSTLLAEVTWNTLATGDGATTPTWDRETASCSRTYCHGSFTFGNVTGTDSSWIWTEPAGNGLCGTCHGLPPDGHFQLTGTDMKNCGSCHSSVVDSSDPGRIIGPSEHINGQAD